MKESALRAAPALAATAALIHAVEAPRHFAEWWGYGLFFIVVAVGQAAFAVMLLLRPRRGARWITVAGIAGNFGIAVLYLVTRTVGIPLVGPEAGEVEAFDRSGLVATLIELLLVGALVVRHRSLGSSAAVAQPGSPPGGRQAAPQGMTVRSAAVVALLAFIGIATIEALPRAIAAQEGGSGPGSALLLGQAVQVACVVVGAMLSIATQERHARAPRLDVPAVFVAMAVGAVALNEHADLGWIVVIGALGGIGLGWLLTAAAFRAMAAPVSERAIAVGLVLLAPVVARAATGWLGGTGLAGVAAGALVLLLIAMVETAFERADAADAALRARAPRKSVLAAAIIAIGVVAIVAGADPSRVLTTMLTRPVGISFDAIDGWRSGFLVAGVAIVLGGSLAAGRQAGLERARGGTVASLAVLNLAASGAGALLVASIPTGPILPGERAVGIVALAGLIGSGVGIGLVTMTGVARRRSSITAAVGAAMLAAAIAAVTGVLSGPGGGVATAIALNTTMGLSAGAGSAALWLGLADGPSPQRSITAATGMAAVTVGLALGPPLARSAAGTASVINGGFPGVWGIGIAAIASLAAVAVHATLVANNRSSRRYDATD